jgi:hypothetical protein
MIFTGKGRRLRQFSASVAQTRKTGTSIEARLTHFETIGAPGHDV